MNKYFILDIPLRRGYISHSPALKKILFILFPNHIKEEIWTNKHDCTEINDLIEGFLKDKLGKQTPDLCLDYFVNLFGDGKIDSQKDTIMQTIAEIVKNKDIIRKNIEKRCE